MSREHFQNMLHEVEHELVSMGEMVITAIERSVRALKNLDKAEAERIIAADAAINRKRWDIENHCVQLFATQQPVAGDLREIVSFMDLVANLERMGDYAKGIATIVVRHDHHPRRLPDLGQPQPGAHRRPRDQHLRAHHLHGHRRDHRQLIFPPLPGNFY